MKTKILRKYPLQVFLYVIAMLTSLAVPYFFSRLIDHVILSGDYSILLSWFFPVLGLAILSSFLSFCFMGIATLRAGLLNGRALSIHAVRKMLSMAVPAYSKNEQGYYQNIAMNSAFTYGTTHAQVYLELVGAAICVVIILGVMFYINPFLGLLFTVYAPLIIFDTNPYPDSRIKTRVCVILL